ncbi:hypothetical protein BKA70DRAFT_1424048 [Coprinopsis sp. MPI-PUGE-AT-0042]|nr:hypothetical protein BKA70DRAFT_1424048 [Coprinopsis sp. MPI-PUGE-AT-0042]
MVSRSLITTSLLLALLTPSTVVSASPVGSSSTTIAELPHEPDSQSASDNLEQERPLLSKREPQPGRNNISNPRGDILKGLLEKLGERKRDLAAIDLDARDFAVEEELVEREPIFGLVKGLFRGGR